MNSSSVIQSSHSHSHVQSASQAAVGGVTAVSGVEEEMVRTAALSPAEPRQAEQEEMKSPEELEIERRLAEHGKVQPE